MKFSWNDLEFTLIDDILYLTRFGGVESVDGTKLSPLAEVHVEGEMNPTPSGVKLISSSEGRRLKYISHSCDEERLTVTMRSELVEARVVFDGYGDTSAVRVHTEVTNIAGRDIILEEVSSFVLTGFGGYHSRADGIELCRFVQGHHRECQPRRGTLFDLGMPVIISSGGKDRVAFTNVGSWSTKQMLPMGILTDKVSGKHLMFQIESSSFWHYELGDTNRYLYLYLGGASRTNCSWSKKLAPSEGYQSTYVSFALGDSLNEVVGEMTKYRRHIAYRGASDLSLPTIFNEYMHFSWDSPSEETTRLAAPTVADMGIEYYVIDCGWHNEEPGNIIYPYVGHWKESHARFPNGVKATLDYVRSLGMKPGLWIEPEIIGTKCAEMLEYYDEDCFLKRGGKPICVFNRLFLDYRAPKVIEYMNGAITRMVEEYGAEYIKFDYNQDLGIGVDSENGDFGEGLEAAAKAFLDWADKIQAKFPNVIFEACASGGMRMDYSTLSHFSLISTSDQTQYHQYPYIAGNILSAVIPEQAAVWSYPVNSRAPLDEVTPDCVAMNMVNALLGRIHLASRIFNLDGERLDLVKEGVAYYKTLSEVKKRALPYLPLGFTDFRQPRVASGFTADGKLYLAVWYLFGEPTFTVKIPEGIKSVKLAYPSSSDTDLSFTETSLSLSFKRKEGAVFLEIDLK